MHVGAKLIVLQYIYIHKQLDCVTNSRINTPLSVFFHINNIILLIELDLLILLGKKYLTFVRMCKNVRHLVIAVIFILCKIPR